VDEYSALLDSLGSGDLKTVARACIVVWYDIYDLDEVWSEFPLQDPADAEPLAMHTMGYLVHATEKTIVVASTVDFGHNQMSQVCVIPKGCIQSIHVL